MVTAYHDNGERFRRLSMLGRIGWWEADFSSKQYLCSEYLCNLLGLDNEILSFADFGQMILEDYRMRVVRELMTLEFLDVYEQTFPIYSTEGVVWVHLRMGYKEVMPDGTLKAFGVLQLVDASNDKREKQALRKVNDLLYRQNSISQSLFRF